MNEVRSVLRRLHYSIDTERAYCDWIKRFVLYHKMTSRAELLQESEAKVEAFLRHLAVGTDVASSTHRIKP